jgi:PilZ domain
VADNRRTPRRRVFKDGVIQAKGLGTACTVRNLSDNGALLNAETGETPEHLTLVIVSEKLVRKCRVIWRDGSKIGVAFV